MCKNAIIAVGMSVLLINCKQVYTEQYIQQDKDDCNLRAYTAVLQLAVHSSTVMISCWTMLINH